MRRLVRQGADVVAFVRPENDPEFLVSQGVEPRVVDLSDHRNVLDHFEDFSTVYHLAAAFRSEFAEPAEFWRINVEATKNLLEGSIRNGVGRFLHCSTVGVQGRIEDPPATEDYRYRPGDHYQESKLEGELAVLEAGEKGLPVSVVRPAGIYGPGDKRFLKLFRAISRRRFFMIGSGESLYHLTYVEDVVTGMLLAAENPQGIGEIFTIGGERYTSLNELVGIIADVLDVRRPTLKVPYSPVYLASVLCERAWKAFGAEPPLYPRRVKFFSVDRAFDTSKAKRILGFRPSIPLEEGVRRTADRYASEGLL